MAGDSKIWIAALFMLVSFIFNAIKKKRKADKQGLDPENKIETDKSESWGLDDLISQFESKYGVENESEYAENMKVKDAGFEPLEVNQLDQSSALLSNTKNEYSEETASHSALKTKRTKVEKTKEIPVSDDTLSLRDMVIHDAILNRPTF